VAGLRAVADGTPAPAAGGRTAWVFGSGSLRPGTGVDLYERFPVFATALDEVCKLLERLPRDVLFDGRQDAQALFAVQVGLVRLLETAGVRPDLVIGHADGEIAAAFAAGVFDLTDACRLIAGTAGDDLGCTAPRIPVIYGGRPADERIATPGHWAERVGRFDEPVAVSGGADVLLELGVCPAMPEDERPPVVLSALGGDRSEVRAVFETLGRLHVMGTTVGWAALLGPEPPPRTVPLPTYAFQRERYWLYDAVPATAAGEPGTEDAGRATDATDRQMVVEEQR
jgi:acyl transferase domain-containing protein